MGRKNFSSGKCDIYSLFVSIIEMFELLDSCWGYDSLHSFINMLMSR